MTTTTHSTIHSNYCYNYISSLLTLDSPHIILANQVAEMENDFRFLAWSISHANLSQVGPHHQSQQRLPWFLSSEQSIREKTAVISKKRKEEEEEEQENKSNQCW